MSGIGVREHDYIGFSEISSSKEGTGSSSSSREMEVKEGVLNLKETELRLGLPGSVSPDRKNSTELNLLGISNKVEEKGQIFMGSLKNFTSGAKRGFLDTVEGSMGEVKGIVGNNWHGKGGGGGEHVSSGFLSPIGSLGKPAMAMAMDGNQKATAANKEQNRNQSVRAAEDSAVTPAAKSQVVSWPPIRSYRRNTMAAAANPMKNTMEAENKCSASSLYVKVSMDGAPYLRKIDLANYKTYQELSTGLEKMFSCFTLGQCGSDGATGRDGLSESRLMDLLQGSEYVLTYEDKDGDWMLVGDVPWEMFTSTCRRLRIMKGSEAIGLAPRAAEKCKNQN